MSLATAQSPWLLKCTILSHLLVCRSCSSSNRRLLLDNKPLKPLVRPLGRCGNDASSSTPITLDNLPTLWLRWIFTLSEFNQSNLDSRRSLALLGNCFLVTRDLVFTLEWGSVPVEQEWESVSVEQDSTLIVLWRLEWGLELMEQESSSAVLESDGTRAEGGGEGRCSNRSSQRSSFFCCLQHNSGCDYAHQISSGQLPAVHLLHLLSYYCYCLLCGRCSWWVCRRVVDAM